MILDILLLINIVISILLSILILTKKGIKYIFIPVILYLFMIDFIHMMHRNSIMYDLFIAKYLLLIPNAAYGLLAYFHTKIQVEDKNIFKGYFGYFAVSFMMMLIYMFTDRVVKQDSSYIVTSTMTNLLMLIISISLINGKMGNSDPLYTENLRINLRMLRALIVLTGGNTLLFFLSINNKKIISDSVYFIFYFISLCTMIYIGYNELFSKNIKHISLKSETEEDYLDLIEDIKDIEFKDNNIPESKIILCDERVLEIATKIESYLNNNKEFQRNPDAKAKILATNIDVKYSEFSYVLKTYFGLTFNNYINSLRIEEAKELIKNNDKTNYTIDTIGILVGFNTKNSFYLAFKKFTDTTPSKYNKSDI